MNGISTPTTQTELEQARRDARMTHSHLMACRAQYIRENGMDAFMKKQADNKAYAESLRSASGGDMRL